MDVLVFLAADYANVAQGGKLNVVGIFNEINATNFPARHPSMHLVIKLGADMVEFGEAREVTVKLLNVDGQESFSLSGDVEIPEGDLGKRPEINLIYELCDLVFPEPGAYEFALLVDRDLKNKLPIRVNEIEKAE